MHGRPRSPGRADENAAVANRFDGTIQRDVSLLKTPEAPRRAGPCRAIFLATLAVREPRLVGRRANRPLTLPRGGLMVGRTEYEPVRCEPVIAAECPLYSGVWPRPGEPFTRWSGGLTHCRVGRLD